MFFTIKSRDFALKEFNAALDSYTTEEKKVHFPGAGGRLVRPCAVFSMGNTPDDLRYYELRFPGITNAICANRRKSISLDPSWVEGQQRVPKVFSCRVLDLAPDARGMMQILTVTSRQGLCRLGLPWRGGDVLRAGNQYHDRHSSLRQNA